MSFLDYPSKEDCCVSVYFVGCEHQCKGCHNEELQYITDRAINVNEEELNKMIESSCMRYRTSKVCFLGGDPLYDENKNTVVGFLKKFGNKYDVCVYTGYNINYCPELIGFNFLKCGQYEDSKHQESMKNDNMIVLGSTNQVLYDRDKKIVSVNGVYLF